MFRSSIATSITRTLDAEKEWFAGDASENNLEERGNEVLTKDQRSPKLVESEKRFFDVVLQKRWGADQHAKKEEEEK